MKKLKLIMILSLCAFVPYVSRADVSAAQANEVQHLLAYVKNSGCVINRNGSDYPAEDGVQHINMKYDYFRDEIKNTEDFIKFSATKSTMSGKYYMATCPGQDAIKTKDWLLAELKKYRENSNEN